MMVGHFAWVQKDYAMSFDNVQQSICEILEKLILHGEDIRLIFRVVLFRHRLRK